MVAVLELEPTASPVPSQEILGRFALPFKIC